MYSAELKSPNTSLNHELALLLVFIGDPVLYSLGTHGNFNATFASTSVIIKIK